MNILLLAGTGTLGRHISDLLSMNGHAVYITSRRVKENKDNMHYYKGNPHDNNFLKSIINEQQSWDVIMDFMVYTTSEFKEKVNLFLDNWSQYIFFSSARVYANSMHALTETSLRLLDVSEDQKFLSTDDYALCKARQENILFEQEKTNYTIVRPYITYGEDRLQLGIQEHETWLRRALNGKHIILQREIAESITTLTYAGDVAKAVCSLIGNQIALGEVFNITTSESVKWIDVLKIYLDVLEQKMNKRPKVKIIIGDKSLDCYQAKYDRLFTRTFDNTKISNIISGDSFMSASFGLKMCLEKFLEYPVYRNLPLNWRQEAFMDQVSGDSYPLKEIESLKDKWSYTIFRYTPYQILDVLRFLKNKIR